MRDDQVAAIREMAPASLAAAAEFMLRSGERDVFIHEEQLLFMARLAIVHGRPSPIGTADPDVISRPMLGVNDLPGREADATAEQLGIHLAPWRMGTLCNDQPRDLIGCHLDLLAPSLGVEVAELESSLAVFHRVHSAEGHYSNGFGEIRFSRGSSLYRKPPVRLVVRWTRRCRRDGAPVDSADLTCDSSCLQRKDQPHA